MMREYLFRGKRKDNGEWVYGGVLQHNDYMAICVYSEYHDWHEFIEVDPETVGQYTGLTDKNGKKIFEGDIVKAVHNSGYIGMPVTDFGIGVVEYSGTYYGGASYQISIIGDAGARVFSPGLEGGVTVLGNVWDNHEVLEDKK